MFWNLGNKSKERKCHSHNNRLFLWWILPGYYSQRILYWSLWQFLQFFCGVSILLITSLLRYALCMLICGVKTLDWHICLQSVFYDRQVNEQFNWAQRRGKDRHKHPINHALVSNVAPFLSLNRICHWPKGYNPSAANISVIRSLYIHSASALTSIYTHFHILASTCQTAWIWIASG